MLAADKKVVVNPDEPSVCSVLLKVLLKFFLNKATVAFMCKTHMSFVVYPVLSASTNSG